MRIGAAQNTPGPASGPIEIGPVASIASQEAPVPEYKYPPPVDYAPAYRYRGGKVESVVRNIPASIEKLKSVDVERYLRELVGYITANSENDFVAVKRIHDWIALNVRYDADSFFAGKIENQDARGVVLSGLSVCEGYSNLFKRLCDMKGIQAKIVRGHGRGFGSSAFGSEIVDDSNHAWNIVHVDGNWYLVDVTWDSGYVEGRSYQPRYSTDYLFLRPEYFVYTHFPSSSQFQLLEKIVSKGEFKNRPLAKGNYFDSVVSFSPEMGKVNHLEGKAVFEIETRDGRQIRLGVFKEDSRIEIPNASFFQQDGNKKVLYVSFPAAGNYTLRLFEKKGDESSYIDCAEYGVVASSGVSIRYPTMFAPYAPGVSLVSPLENPLRVGTTYRFEISVPAKKYVALFAGGKFNRLAQDGGSLFSGSFAIPAGSKEVSIGCSDSESGRYDTLVSYEVGR